MSGECDFRHEHTLECKCSIRKSETPICRMCGVSTNEGCSVNNNLEKKTFRYLEKGERMHLECYIDHVLEETIKKKGYNPML